MTTRSKLKANKTTISTFAKTNALARIPQNVSLIERADMTRDGSTIYCLRISYKDLDNPGYLIADDEVKFYHCCDAAANGTNCNHWVYAGAIAGEHGHAIEKTYFPKSPVDYQNIIDDLDIFDYKDISSEFGVTSTNTPTVTSTTGTPKTSATPKSTVITKRDWSDGYNEVLEYLKSENIEPSVIARIKELRKSIFENVQMTEMATDPIKPDLPYMGSYFGRAIRHILSGKDILLNGEKGCGKDTLVATIAWVLGLPVYIQTGNENETKESIVGERSFANGEVFFKLSPFASSVKFGGITNYSELNMVHPSVTAVFHPVFDENRQLPTVEGAITRHPNHIFIGSMNIGEQYAGVSLTNGALVDRFAVLELPYSVEFKELLSRKSGFTDNRALQFLEDVKKQIDDLMATESTGERSNTIRGYIDAAKHFKYYGVSLRTKIEAIEDFVLNKTEDKTEKYKLRDRLRQSIFPDLPKTKDEEDYENGAF